MTQLIICKACGLSFDSWRDLAKHISRQKDRLHNRGKKWAAKVIMKQRQLDSKRDLQPRIPLTAEQREAKKDTRRELSGEIEQVKTICPQCKHSRTAILPIEYTQSDIAWKKNDRFVVMCNACRG